MISLRSLRISELHLIISNLQTSISNNGFNKIFALKFTILPTALYPYPQLLYEYLRYQTISQPVRTSYFKNLQVNRRLSKLKDVKRSRLSANQREEVLAKTAGLCHICGIELNGDFQTDHVKAHGTGGSHTVDNYLPACSTCNNYRWHYSPQEIQVILKLGVWAKTAISNNEELGSDIAKAFIKHEMGVRNRKRKYKPSKPIATIHPDEYVLGGSSKDINPARKLKK